jgi:hypothetical protein
MNAIEKLEEKLRTKLPGTKTELDRPGDPNATWWLDATHGDHSVTVEWRPSGGGFGLSSSEVEGFEGSDERIAAPGKALERALSLLRTGEQTKAPRIASLPELRAAKAIRQEKLAKTLGVKQAQVSKLERQGNMRLTTLKNFVGAMGGELEIRARFKDEAGDVIITGPWTKTKAKPKKPKASRGGRRSGGK